MSFTPRINLDIVGKTSNFISEMQIDNTTGIKKGEFKEVLGGLVQGLNKEIEAPDAVMKDVISGSADIHDVMAAIAKSDIQVSMATTATSKILQAYEKVMNIQI
ncbi:flagellar hook-basal body complex protein FliE [bacterium]|nr:flagellar hook-basal body complex protein FliE [bacterium]